MDIVGFYVKNTTIANSEGEIIQSPPYLKWLLNHPPQTIQTFYHMEHCLDNLLNIIGINGKCQKELLTSTKLCIEPYKFRYIPNKFFSIKRSNHRLSYFCNMSQYFLEFDDSKLSIGINETDKEYCLRLANRAKEVGVIIYDSLVELGFNPTSLTSLSKIYESLKLETVMEYDNLKKYINSKIKYL